MHLNDLFDPAALKAEIDAGFIQQRHHPQLPLTIYTYTRACQYEQHWTPVTTRCRGLIVEDTTGRIVAQCLPKFFNYSEHEIGQPYAPPLPAVEPFRVFDKVDGSLAIVFHHHDPTIAGGPWRVASKGSFVSEQAHWAAHRIQALDTSRLHVDLTYLAEAIYPQNRIVVNYGDRQDLVLLAVIRQDGVELPVEQSAEAWAPIGSVVTSHTTTHALPFLAGMAAANQKLPGGVGTGSDAEGYVIRFASGTRVKLKLAEYQRLHKLITGVTERDIWRAAGFELFADLFPDRDLARALSCSTDEIQNMRKAEHGPLATLLEHVPDEFDTWVRTTAQRLIDTAEAFARVWILQCAELTTGTQTRADFARRVATTVTNKSAASAMFLLYDKRSTRLHAWRLVKPDRMVPFIEDEETEQ